MATAKHRAIDSFCHNQFLVRKHEELGRDVETRQMVQLNRAVAVAMASRPAPGFELTEKLTAESSLKNYHLLPSVGGDPLTKLGVWLKHVLSSNVQPLLLKICGSASCYLPGLRI